MDSTYAGSCHCGAVTFEAQVDLGAVGTCNCSRCRRLGVIWSFAPKEDFTLMSGEEVLTSYRFNKGVIEHLFCSVCGVEVFARGQAPVTGAEMVATNVRCLHGIDPEALMPTKFDGASL